MKRSTAVRHLVEMGEEASDLRRLRDSDVGWPLEEIWATGELLDSNGDLDAGSVILLLDVAPAELPWLAMHQVGEWVGERLRLGKRPMLWCYRPSVWPPWNARHRRVARVWAAATGLDDDMIESLRSGRRPSIVEPSEYELREQLVEERAASLVHLRQMVDDYWEPEWRRRRRGEQREDYLWRAAAGLIEIEDALASISD